MEVFEILADKARVLSTPADRRQVKFIREKVTNRLSAVPDHPNVNWLELLAMGVPGYQVGAKVLDYCMQESSTRAFVFFSLDESQVKKLVDFMANVNGLNIVYAANLELSQVGVLNLIELCYGHKPWFTNRVRRKMSRERSVYSSRVSVILYSGWDKEYDNVQKLKADLRGMLPKLTFERRIHGTDDSVDTLTLVEAITNPNTMDLIGRVLVSRGDRVFSRVPDFVRNNPDVCIDGSSIMELYGLRKSRDLDLICIGEMLRSTIEARGYDVNNDRYDWLPISSDEVISDPHLHVRLFGLKFTSLATRQLVLGFEPHYKQGALNPKKIRDLQSISLFNLGKPKTRLGLAGFTGTFFTQTRLIYEFLLIRLIPRLPTRLVGILRKIRSLIYS